jgi:hypothetical protein
VNEKEKVKKKVKVRKKEKKRQIEKLKRKKELIVRERLYFVYFTSAPRFFPHFSHTTLLHYCCVGYDVAACVAVYTE